MMDLVVSSFDIEESFWELPSCFYTRNLDLEEVHCVPYTETRKGSTIGESNLSELLIDCIADMMARYLLLSEISRA
jgi:hypothetical protein